MITARASIVPDDALAPRSLGEALRLLRHRSRVSRDEFARLVGVSAGAVSNYENDVSVPPAPTLRRAATVLARLLELSPADLWEELGQVIDRAGDSDR
jgi:transcriptional regulator with XRE-family HTH domain